MTLEHLFPRAAACLGRRCAAPLLLTSVLILTPGLAGCSNSTTAPSSTAPFSQLDLRVGTGTEAAAGNALTVNYTAWLYDASKADFKGLLFETSVGSTALNFTLGTGQVIQGWDQGIPGMKIGGVRRLVIPPSLAYGKVRQNTIPPYATVIFEVELLDVQ